MNAAPPRPGLARWRRAAALPMALALAACIGAGGQPHEVATRQAVVADAPVAEPARRRELPGAGAVAFDPAAPRLAWAAGERVRVIDLDSGEEVEYAVGAWVDDLGFASDGSLWLLAGEAEHWRDGERLCRTQALDVERLLALDAQGAVVAGYSHSDGVGMLRRQVWLDPACAVTAESTRSLPAGVDDAESDPGEPLRRDSLQAPRTLPLAAGPPLQARPVAASRDGRWWVFEEGGIRSLWDAGPPRQ